MAKVTLTTNLKKYYPEQVTKVSATTLLEVLKKMDEVRPQFSHYIIDEQNQIRKHVNVFINKTLVRDKKNLNISVSEDTEIHLMQALSGG